MHKVALQAGNPSTDTDTGLPLLVLEAESLEEELQLVEEKAHRALPSTCQCLPSRDKMPQAAATTSQAAARRAEQRQQLETLENQLCRDCKVSYNCMLYFNYTIYTIIYYLPYTRLLDY